MSTVDEATSTRIGEAVTLAGGRFLEGPVRSRAACAVPPDTDHVHRSRAAAHCCIWLPAQQPGRMSRDIGDARHAWTAGVRQQEARY
jgi:hypothetical protein